MVVLNSIGLLPQRSLFVDSLSQDLSISPPTLVKNVWSYLITIADRYTVSDFLDVDSKSPIGSYDLLLFPILY